jgi:hypothetical protein
VGAQLTSPTSYPLVTPWHPASTTGVDPLAWRGAALPGRPTRHSASDLLRTPTRFWLCGPRFWPVHRGAQHQVLQNRHEHVGGRRPLGGWSLVSRLCVLARHADTLLRESG